MLDRDPFAPSWRNRLLSLTATEAGEVLRRARQLARSAGAIGPRSRTARRFGSFGDGSIITYPAETLVNVRAIHIGRNTVIGTYVSLSAGWMPDQPDLPDRVVGIGDRCLIGRGSTVIGQRAVEIGDDVWTGHHCHITDMNHDYTDVDLPISQQAQPEALAHHLLDLPERIRGSDRGPPPSHGRQPRRRAGVTPTGKAVATDAPLHPRIDRSLPWRFPGPSRTR